MPNNTQPNIIILTHGWTGSSVFAALLGEAGYWLGSDTIHKPDYNTFENADLVSINRGLFSDLLPSLNHEHRFEDDEVHEIERLSDGMDFTPMRDFVGRCSQHRPWLWKDPRLTWSIRVWAHVLDLENTAFLVLTRDHTQAWISANTRRHVQSPRFTRDYNSGITQCNLRFLQSRGLRYVQASFEDLLLEPEQTLAKLNGLFSGALSMDQLRKVCREPLGRKSRGFKDLLLASLIYIKNYDERDGRGHGAQRQKLA